MEHSQLLDGRVGAGRRFPNNAVRLPSCTPSMAPLIDAVARKNVSLTVANIREKRAVLRDLEDLESTGSIKIAGSMYNLETGMVEFLA
jgi:carbonic anhydrase